MHVRSKTNLVTPHFFTFLAKVDHYLSAWQVLKKSVHGNFWAQTSLSDDLSFILGIECIVA